MKSCLTVHEETVAKSKLCFSKMSFQFSETEGVYVRVNVCVRMYMHALEREVCVREEGMCVGATRGYLQHPLPAPHWLI